MAGCGDHTRKAQAGCIGCQDFSRRYRRRRLAQIADGTWLPRVPAADVHAHVVQLQAAGLSLTGIARAAGLEKGAVIGLPNKRWVTGRVAAAIRSVRAEDTIPAGFVLSVGAARMVQALCALGWSFRDQSAFAGVTKSVLCDVANRQHRLISRRGLARTRALFERLSGTPGPNRRTRLWAQRKGWLPPLAWDDVAAGELAAPAEDPDASAVDEVAVERALTGERIELTDAELIAAAQIGVARGLSQVRLAARLDVSVFAVKRLLDGEIPHQALETARSARRCTA